MDTLNVVEPKQEPLSFSSPHVMKKDAERDLMVVDYDASEIAYCFQALGRPSVYYLAKANKYFKDAKCTNPMSDTEVESLGLPLPLVLETKRRKIREEANREGRLLKEKELYSTTVPTHMDPPEHIKARLVNMDPTERMIQRINRSALVPK
jgi:hypothetical protein